MGVFLLLALIGGVLFGLLLRAWDEFQIQRTEKKLNSTNKEE